ncbi:BET1 homolog [Babylonia areolata]|uniref:BET1 homolog n=1 Tax=Babylonia areolata TaxID=304850 RepID=UPI003FD68B85
MRRSNMNQPGYGNGQHQGQYQPTADMLEEENSHLTEALRGKVQALKSMSIDIGTEVKEQNKVLNAMDEDFDKSGNFLQATMDRLKRLTRAGHYKLWIYLLLFVFFVFFMCWVIIRF